MAKTKVSKTEEVTLSQAIAEEAATGETYSLTEKADKIVARTTLQRVTPNARYGRDWRVPGHKAPSLRQQVVEVLAGLDTFTMAEAEMAIRENKLPLNSGTPRSFIRAFIKEGIVA